MNRRLPATIPMFWLEFLSDLIELTLWAAPLIDPSLRSCGATELHSTFLCALVNVASQDGHNISSWHTEANGVCLAASPNASFTFQSCRGWAQIQGFIDGFLWCELVDGRRATKAATQQPLSASCTVKHTLIQLPERSQIEINACVRPRYLLVQVGGLQACKQRWYATACVCIMYNTATPMRSTAPLAG